MSLTLLTMTGARPEAFELCKRWMRGQHYPGPVRWIIVDDGPEPSSLVGVPDRWQIEAVYPEPKWEPGKNTQARNILAGLEHVRHSDKLLVIEDDDYYSPRYLGETHARLALAELIGEKRALYFNLATGAGKRCNNRRHAGLCSTAMRGPAIDALRKAAATEEKFIDLVLWKNYTRPRRLFETDYCVGIKGLPGRGGIGAGHRIKEGPIREQDVRRIIGPDWQHLKPYLCLEESHG